MTKHDTLSARNFLILFFILIALHDENLRLRGASILFIIIVHIIIEGGHAASHVIVILCSNHFLLGNTADNLNTYSKVTK